MAIQKPTRVAGGDFLDLKELCATGPVLVLFRIVEFLPPVPDKFRRNTYPVRADALICSGPRAGQVVYANAEGYKFAPANSLRGLTVEASDAGEQPKYGIGDELPFIVQMITHTGNPFVGLDPAEGEALDVILSVHADGAGWTADAARAETPAPEAAAPAPAPAAAPAAATPITSAPSAAAPAAAPAGARPWQTAAAG